MDVEGFKGGLFLEICPPEKVNLCLRLQFSLISALYSGPRRHRVRWQPRPPSAHRPAVFPAPTAPAHWLIRICTNLNPLFLRNQFWMYWWFWYIIVPLEAAFLDRKNTLWPQRWPLWPLWPHFDHSHLSLWGLRGAGILTLPNVRFAFWKPPMVCPFFKRRR